MMREITFTPTLRCNFRCMHCAVALEDKEKDELSLDEISAMLHCRLSAHADFFITGGEPYVREDLDEIIKIVLQNTDGLVKVLTNGYLIDRCKKTADRFRNYRDRLRFSISLDGPEPQHNKIRNNNRSYERAVESIKLLSTLGYDVHACCIIQPKNINNISELRASMAKEKIRLSLSPLMEFGTSTQYSKNYNGGSTILWNHLNATPANYGYVMSQGKMRISSCHSGIDSLYISPYGDVSECFVRKDFLPQLGGGCSSIIGNTRKHGPDLDRVYKRFDPKKRLSAQCPGCSNESEIIRESLNHDMAIPFLPDAYERLEGPIPCSVTCGSSDFDKLLINGWSYAEGTHRWTQGTAHVYLRGKGSHLRFTALCCHPDIEQKEVTLDVYVDNLHLGKIHFNSALKNKFIDKIIVIPQVLQHNEIHELRFIVDRVWESRVNGVRRRHGLAFKSVSITTD